MTATAEPPEVADNECNKCIGDCRCPILCPGCGCPALPVDEGDSERCGWLGTPAEADELRAKLTPRELAAYDAETCVLVREAETITAHAESVYANSKEQASSDKKYFEGKVESLRRLIRDRAENRGKRPTPPEKTLLDAIPAWREYPIERLAIMRPEKCTCTEKQITDCCDGARCEACEGDWPIAFITLEQAGITTLGDLSDQIGPAYNPDAGPVFGLPRETIDAIREQVHAIIDSEFKAAESDLYKQYPLDRWTRFGLTEKDIEKLHAGETKGTASSVGPISTVGDLQRFVSPNPNCPSYSQSVKDIKGMGDKGAERMSEAEMQFWGWWRAGGEAEFAAEQAPTSFEADIDPATGEARGAPAGAAWTPCQMCGEDFMVPNASGLTTICLSCKQAGEPSANGKHATTDAPKTPRGKPSKRGAKKE